MLKCPLGWLKHDKLTSWIAKTRAKVPSSVLSVSPLCSSLYVFPFLLVACLSPSVCQYCFICAFPCYLTCPLPSSLLTCSSSPHQCVCVYSMCLPCTPCHFVWCDVLKVPCVSALL